MTTDLTTIEIPAFDFTAFYYPQLLEALLEFKRLNVPELTDESPQEPLIQVLRAMALVGHLNNTLVDLVANESTLPTARLVETVRNMLRLIDYEMASATPAQTDIIFELAQVLSSTVEVLDDFTQVATRGVGGEPARFYEVLDAYLVTRTDRLTKCFRVENDGGGPIYTDFTTEANDVLNPFTAWASPLGGSNLREGDSLLFGHSEAMWNEVDIDLNTDGLGIKGTWEYFDGNFSKTIPTLVTDNGSTLTLNLTDYLGVVDLRGTPIRIKLNETGAFEDRFSYFSGGANKVDTLTLLGQSSPSTTSADYTIGSPWERFKSLEDATIDALDPFDQDGKVKYDLPQSLTENWSLGTINGQEAFWMRFRITTVSAPVAPSITRIRIDTDKQFIKRNAVQGRFQSETLGSSTGAGDQSFLGSKENFIFGSDELSVNDIVWTRVDNFLTSKPTDRHYRVQLEENDRPNFIFGDGVAGAIPPGGVNNVSVTYRWGAQDDGNVGADTIVVDKSGLALVNSLYNPRPATGWAEAEGASDASLAKAKVAGPATLRVRDVALGPDDAEVLATRAAKIDSTIIGITRARAIEEGFGPKTIELVIVGAGGVLATQTQLDAVSEFFNGNQFSSPVKQKRLVHNQEATAVNYTPKPITITAVVKARGNVTAVQIGNALIRLLQPEALKDDGVSFEWEFGDSVPTSRLIYEIFKVDATIYDVDISVPASDVVLLTRELPTPGTLTITVTA